MELKRWNFVAIKVWNFEINIREINIRILSEQKKTITSDINTMDPHLNKEHTRNITIKQLNKCLNTTNQLGPEYYIHDNDCQPQSTTYDIFIRVHLSK